MSRSRQPIHIEPKGWGREVWIANNPLYCGKILEIRRGKRCSLHYHKLKTESFFLRTGRLRIRIKQTPREETIEEFEMEAGQCLAGCGKKDFRRLLPLSYLSHRERRL